MTRRQGKVSQEVRRQGEQNLYKGEQKGSDMSSQTYFRTQTRYLCVLFFRVTVSSTAENGKQR